MSEAIKLGSIDELDFNGELLGQLMGITLFKNKVSQPTFYGACAGADRKQVYLLPELRKNIKKPYHEMDVVDRFLQGLNIRVSKLPKSRIFAVEVFAEGLQYDLGIEHFMNDTSRPYQ